MTSDIPSSTDVLVIGAGVHGLSTAWHLAQDGTDVLVVDKTRVAAGASGIACGIIRNNYFQPAMSELMAACVDIWEANAEVLSFHQAGYVALGPAAQNDDLTEVFERHQRIGYASELIVGEAEVFEHMSGLFPDWRARGLTVCLHESRSGFAFNRESMHGLAGLAQAAGARIATGVEVTGFTTDNAGTVTAAQTSAGTIAANQVVVAVGPWIAQLWSQLGLPDTLDVHQPGGAVARDVPMWTGWYLQEGEVDVPPRVFDTAGGAESPVLHVDSDEPLLGDDGRLITGQTWGIYVKPDRDSVQGGAAPIPLHSVPDPDPYPSGGVTGEFADMWCAALSHCLGRFEGVRAKYREVRSGGLGMFTADSFPVFDLVRPNVFVAADSNHGYKMIAVGREIARVLGGEHSALLHPFRLDRFATGDLHPVSHTPYPWS